MMNYLKKGRGLVLVLLMAMLLVVGCTKNEKSSEEKILENETNASMALQEGNIEGALDAYEEILALDPKHVTANFVVMVGHLMRLAVDPTVQEVVQTISPGTTMPTNLNEMFQFDPSAKNSKELKIRAKSYINKIKSASTPGYQVSDTVKLYSNAFYKLVGDALIPTFAKIEVNVDNLLSYDDLRLFLSPSMSGMQQTIEVDKAEFYALKMLINFYLAIFHEAIMYDWIIDENTYQDIPDVFAKNPDFGKLRSDGVEHSRAARDSYLDILNSFTDMVAYLKAETDLQYDDVIPNDEDTLPGSSTLAIIESFKNSFEGNAITVPIEFFLHYSGVFRTFNLELNLGDFYTTPLEDMGQFMAIKDVNHDHQVLENEFPANFDYTIGGLFPNLNSYQAWRNSGLILYFEEYCYAVWEFEKYCGAETVLNYYQYILNDFFSSAFRSF
jgi:tetratricopeptide (TPR) repeat protein